MSEAAKPGGDAGDDAGGAAGDDATWVVIVPVKGSTASKTRLANFPLSPEERRRLALAFALDTVQAISEVATVRAVVVVTSDVDAASALSALGALIVADPAEGLNRAITEGLRFTAARFPDANAAVITGDLPTLTAADVAAGLDAATRHPLAFIADADGTGTTTITARVGATLEPLYGGASAARHASSGLVRLDIAAASTLRHDVDTPADLAAAVAAGVGPHTSRALAT